MSDRKEPNRPSHTIYQVTGEGDKARWTKIGAAWMHADLKGANLKFDAFPLSGRIVVRDVTEDGEIGDRSTRANNGGRQ